MTQSHDRGPGEPSPLDAEGATLPSDPEASPELANAATVAARTVATSARRREKEPFSLVSGESLSPQVDARSGDLEGTRGAARYERGPQIGAGGMGEVRLHLDLRIGRRVAKKTLHASIDSRATRQRFLREARVQGQLEHPAIVPVYDLDVGEDGQVFFTMKRVRGLTLERVLERLYVGDAEITRRFSTRKLLTAISQVCLAVDYAHSRGVIHRDLKPGNIMLGSYGEVYVLDWGLAKVSGDGDEDAGDGPESRPVVGASAALTRGGALLGTPAYMSPEQLLRRTDEVDSRSDVFALGAVLFEIVAREPLRTSHDADVIARALDEEKEHLRPSSRAEGVAPELDEICARALCHDRSQRLAKARDLAEAIDRFLDGEQDASLRRELAARHAEAARKKFEGERAPPSDLPRADEEEAARPSGGAPERVEALRETMKALAFDAQNEDAQRLLVELLTDVSGAAPDEARRALSAQADQKRAAGLRLGMWGLLCWLAIFPVVVVIGVKSWPAVGATAALTTAAAALARWLSTQPRARGRGVVALTALVSLVVAMTSCYMGPFTVVPTCAATVSILFGMHATRRERPFITALVSLGALAPFLAEITGALPRAYTFEPDRVIVFARAIALPEGATTGAMIYSTLSFIILAAILMGRMRDALQKSEERHFLQAWYLRELFPAGQPAVARRGPLG